MKKKHPLYNADFYAMHEIRKKINSLQDIHNCLKNVGITYYSTLAQCTRDQQSVLLTCCVTPAIETRKNKNDKAIMIILIAA